MTRLVGSEIFKLRTTRTFYGLMGGALALVLVITVLVAALANPGPNDKPLNNMMGIASFIQIFALMLGILAVTSEFRHGTITPSLLAVPDRLRLVLGKLGACLLVGLAIGLLATGLVALISVGIFSARDIPHGADANLFKLIVGGTLATGLDSALGLGIGTVVRNQVGAIIGTLVYSFVLENLLLLVPWLKDQVPKYGLGAVGNALSAAGGDEDKVLGQVPGGLLLAAYAAIFLAAGVVMLRRRDISA
jgi:ABC-2 type transport system permease protein